MNEKELIEELERLNRRLDRAEQWIIEIICAMLKERIPIEARA